MKVEVIAAEMIATNAILLEHDEGGDVRASRRQRASNAATAARTVGKML